MVCAVNNHTENLEQPVFTFNSGSYTGPLLCSSNYTITEGVAGSSHVTFQSDILDQARVARSACQSLFQLRLSAGLMLIMSKPVQVYLIAYMHRHILVFAWFCVEFGPDTNAPIAPGLSFACAAKLLCQSNSSPFVAASRLYPGARDDFMEKSNVLLQITSLSLWAVNFLPCVSALQRNTGGREYPPFFSPVFGGYLQKGYHVLFPKSKLLKNDSRRVDGSVYYFSACPCKVIYGCLTAASPLLANHRLCRWSKGLICALLFCSRLRWFKAARGWYDYLASTDMCALSG